MQLSPDQNTTITALSEWLKKIPSPYITVGGYAGTGKTTLISLLRRLIHEQTPQKRVAFACYTGKASQVLKSKLIEQDALYTQDFCGTIHSLMYTAQVDDDGKIIAWRRNLTIPYDLLIVDEASMVTEEIWRDLQKYNLPIVAVGDHGQLPPIGGNFNLMDAPQLRLEQIHRQTHNNPIIDIATLARTTGQIPFQKFAPTVQKVQRGSDDADEICQRVFSRTQEQSLVLCGRNMTRIQLNKYVRQIRGYETEFPVAGETLICLKNNYEAEGGPIYNGMIGKLNKVESNGDHWLETEIYFPDEDRSFEGKISKHQFHQEKYIDKVRGLPTALIGDRFDFGYALTVHKAQGSQADTVLLFEERSQYMQDDEWRRWLYTAVTRAVQNLYIIGG